jgi:putative addiction module component (TIGR02574 family)
MEKLDDLVRQVLELPLEQRSSLAERLLESLDELTPQELEQVWAGEAERRYKAYKSGKIESYPGPQVHDQVLDEIK